MAPVTTETEIDLPAAPAEVFAQLLDAARYERWQPLHAAWPDGVPELAEGASFTQRTRYAGQTADVRWTVVELHAPESVVLEGAGPMGLRLRSVYALRGEGGGTRLRASSAAEGGPLAGPLRRVARRRARGVAEESLTRLRDLVDEGAGASRRPAPTKRPSKLAWLPRPARAALATVGSLRRLTRL